MKKNELMIGLNLGGWISQYPVYDHEYFRTFICQEDIQRIADWGFDHVRLPVDYPVLEDDRQPGQYLQQGFVYIDACLAWCKQSGLKMILDLHKAPGYAFDDLKSVSLFNNQSMQQRLLDLWAALATRYASEHEVVALELLNEIVLPESGPWNALYPRMVQTIRAQAPNSLLILGGNYYNAADQLQYLTLLPDPDILYTFHHYLPLVVTHYQAPWLEYTAEYRELVVYPGKSIPAQPGLADRYPRCKDMDEFNPGTFFNKAYQEEKIAPALEFSKQNNQPVYCGEFGVIDSAPIQNRINWTRDCIELMNENKVGRAFWTYKALDFGLVDPDGLVISDELVRIAAMR
jgi:endoglucanase